ncbi:MAG: CHAT domain-containing protein [Acidobacteriota bacterium]
MEHLKRTLACGIILVGFFAAVSPIKSSPQEQRPADIRDLPDKRAGEARMEGRRFYFQGDFEAARHKFREASILSLEIQGFPDSLSLKYEGLCYQYLDDFDQAMPLFQEALGLDEQFGQEDNDTIADGINNIGWLFYLKGDYTQALTYLERAEAISRAADPPGARPVWNRGRVLTSLGAVYESLGNYSTAFKYLSHVLDQERIRKDSMCRTRALQHMGNLERSWGNFSKAIQCYEEAVRVARQAHDDSSPDAVLFNRAYLVEALNDFGVLLYHHERKDQAEAAFEEALTISRQLGTRRLIARSLINLGNLFRHQERLTDAVNYHQEALRLSEEAELTPMIAMSSAELGLDFLKSENYKDAVLYLDTALNFERRGLTADMKARVCFGLAEAHEKIGDLKKAMEYYHCAIESIENVRLETLTEDRKIGYWQTKHTLFERAISLIYKLHGKDPKAEYQHQAFAYSEQARARAFLDLMAESKVRIDEGPGSQMQQEEHMILREIARINRALLREELSRAGRTKLEKELAEAEERSQDLQQRVRLASPALAELRYPKPVTLEELRRTALDEQTLLVEFLLGEKQSYMWLVSRKEFQMVTLRGRKQIKSQVAQFRRTITSPPQSMASFDRYYRAAFQLYDLLLRPVEKTLEKYNRLIIVADGVLHYVPFEALVTRMGAKTAGRPSHLLLRHQISYAPSASVLAQMSSDKRMRGERLELIAYGDPIFSKRKPRSGSKKPDNALTSITRDFYAKRGARLDPLPFTRQEINGIVAEYPRRSCKTALGLEAAESNFKGESLDRFRRLHLATHGLIDERIPARSGIVFSLVGDGEEDGILQMNEIFNLKLDADLVVLSACRTGLGRLVSGEGIIGLVRAFLYAGSSNVVVSLWNVQDQSTARFMKRFYKRLKEGRGQSEALRKAKLDMINSDIPLYRHPYYWATFVLAGIG